MTTFDLGPTRGLRPDERDDAPVVSLGQMFGSAVEESHKASNFDAHLFNYSNAFDSISDRVKAATGEALDNPFRSATAGQSVEMLGTYSREAVEGSTLYAQWRQRVQELRTKHADKLDWDALLEEPGRVAQESMKKAREDYGELQRRGGMATAADMPLSDPFFGTILSFGSNAIRHPGLTAAQLLGGLWGQMRSPADAAANVVSFGAAGAAKSILKAALANALTNASAQALLSAPKQLSYKSAGLPYGTHVWLEEVAAAGATGFALDAGIRTPARAAISRFGRDTPAGTAFSRNTERGGILFDAVTDATPAPRPRIEIDPETIRKAEAGDIAASREILEKTGAMEDPAVKGAVEHMEAGGKLTEDVLDMLEREFGIARPDGVRTLAAAMKGQYVDGLPEPIRQATEPLQHEQGAALLDRAEAISGAMERLPPQVRQAVQDGLEAGIPKIVQAVEKVLDGAPDRISERLIEAVAPLLDERTMAEVRLHSGRAGPIEMARAIRQFPDLIDSNARLDDGRLSIARTIAGMDDLAYADVARGTVPAEVAVMVAERVPRESQAKVLADLQRAEPRTAAEAADLIEALTPPRRVLGTEGQLAAGSKVDDPAGPAAKAQTETLRQEAGQTYVDVMAPIERRAAIEEELKKLRGQLIKGKREDAPQKAEGGEAKTPDPGDIRRQIEALEREHAALQAEIDPGPQGQVLARLAMRAIDRRREADLVAAVNDAMRMLPEGVRVEVRPDDDLVFRAANGERADATSDEATGHIQLALAATDPMAKIGHEAVHTLVTLGHLSPDEVGGLATLAREAGTFKLEDRYRKAYAGRDNLEQIITEEAASSYIEARIKGDVMGPENTIVERVRQLMERIRQALKGYGFQSREDVVQAIMSGEAARREARAEWRRDAVAQGKAEMKAAADRGTTLPDGTEIKGVPLFAIRAFHGSPHDFDRFDITKIGTGEGAQAYGHGLYFAERQGVAEFYRDEIGVRIDGRMYDEYDPVHQAAVAVFDTGSRESAIRSVEEQITKISAVHDGGYRQRMMRALSVLKSEQPLPDVLPGRLYEVRISAEPEDFVDWDKPLGDQPTRVREALEKIGYFGEGRSFREGLRKLQSDYGGQYGGGEMAASMLSDAGIKGIRYLDQGSRTAGEGTHNYVVFDDNLIEIVAKDGLPVRTAPESEQIARGGEQLFALRDGIDRSREPRLGEALSPATEAERTAILAEIRKALPAGVGVRFVDSLGARGDGSRAQFVFSSPEILIRKSLEHGEVYSAVNHELVHALKNLNLFTTVEWQLLVGEARRSLAGKAMHVVDDDGNLLHGPEAYRTHYERQLGELAAGTPERKALVDDLIEQELVASLMESWTRGERIRPEAATLFERIKAMIERLGNALRGLGFQTADDVLARIESGGIAAREGRRLRGVAESVARERGDDTLFALREPEPPIKSDMAFVDRMNRMGELIAVCKG